MKKPSNIKGEGRSISEQVAVKIPQKKMDGYLKAAGVTLAAGCAILPFAVYLQQSEPAPTLRDTAQITDPLDRSAQKLFRKFSSFRPMEKAGEADEIDPSTTAAIMSNGKGLPGVDPVDPGKTGSIEDQPFPKPAFRLRDVAGNLAMIEDQSGYWFVEPGSLLPDGSTLMTISRSTSTGDAGSWQIQTSSGDLIEQVP